MRMENGRTHGREYFARRRQRDCKILPPVLGKNGVMQNFFFDIRQKTGVDHPCLLCPYSSRNIIFQAELMQKM